jgi:hypothetical protein
MDGSLPEGLQVRLALHDRSVDATVRHCTRNGNEYRIGLEFPEPFDCLSEHVLEGELAVARRGG